MLDDTTTTETTMLTDAADAAPVTEGAPVDGTLLTGDEKPAGEAEAPATDADKPAEEAPAGAPEDYGDFTLADGVTLDETMLGEFKGVAKDLNLPQDAAQKVVDLAVKMRQADAAAIVEVRNQWLEATKADAEFGGDKLAENLATAKRGLDAYGSPALRELLNQTGLGNHPEMIRLLMKAGKTASEDTFVGGQRTPSVKPTAHILYPTSAPKEQ